MGTLESIHAFTSVQHVAVVGVSNNAKKFGSLIFRHLVKSGYTVYPVNPAMEYFDGVPCYPSVTALPADVQAAVIVTSPSVTLQVLHELEHTNIPNIWIQQGAEDAAVKSYLASLNLNAIWGRCIFMFTRPKGIHKFHEFLSKVSGCYPK